MRLHRIDSSRLVAQAAAQVGKRLDANETLVFSRMFEHIYSRTWDVEYLTSRIREFIPLDTEVGPLDETFTYRQYDERGEAAIVDDHANDFPSVEIFGKEYAGGKIHSVGASFRVSFMDMRRAAAAGVALSDRKAKAARNAIERKIETLGVSGDTALGVGGFINAPNIIAVTDPSAATSWRNKTVAERQAAINAGQRATFDATGGMYVADTCLMPTTFWSVIAPEPQSPTFTEKSQLQYMQAATPWLKTWDHWNKLNTAGASGKGRIMFYAKDPDVLGLVIPQDFETFEPQVDKGSIIVPCHARTGGVWVRKPKCVAYMDVTY
jgi:hypothetical protein